MAAPRVGSEFRFGWAEEATYGTALADSSAASQLVIAPTEVDPDYKQLMPDRMAGSGFKELQNVIQHNKGSVPKISISSLAHEEDLDYLLYLFFQNVSEDALTPFAKTFTPSSPAPDFANNEGIFMTGWLRSPTASKTEKMTSLVCDQLTLKADKNSDDGFLTYTANLFGKAYSGSANPTGTWTRIDTTEIWNIRDLDTMTLDGSAVDLFSFELNLSKTYVLVGIDGSGSWHNLAFPVYTMSQKYSLVSTGASRTAFGKVSSGARVDASIRWCDGTSDGDLTIDTNLVINPASRQSQPIDGIELINLEGTMVYDSADTGNEDPIKIIIANSIDRTW